MTGSSHKRQAWESYALSAESELEINERLHISVLK